MCCIVSGIGLALGSSSGSITTRWSSATSVQTCSLPKPQRHLISVGSCKLGTKIFFFRFVRCILAAYVPRPSLLRWTLSSYSWTRSSGDCLKRASMIRRERISLLLQKGTYIILYFFWYTGYSTIYIYWIYIQNLNSPQSISVSTGSGCPAVFPQRDPASIVALPCQTPHHATLAQVRPTSPAFLYSSKRGAHHVYAL